MKKSEALGIGMVVVLVLALLAPMGSAEAVEITIEVVGGTNLTFIEKLFSYLSIMGSSDIQFGKSISSWSTNPPTLGSPTSYFSKGDTVTMVFTARNVQNGAYVSFDFCDYYGTCEPAIILAGRSGIHIEGDWDLWWAVATFTADKSITLEASQYIYPTDVKVSSESIIVTDPCVGVCCFPYCSGDTLFSDGYCSGGNCYYSSSELCPYGCHDGAPLGSWCNLDPCRGVTCPSYCSGNTRYYNGYCSGGDCQYSSQTCSYGCSGGVCTTDPCQGVTCPNYCSGNTLLHNGNCVGGSCQYTQTNCEYGCSGETCNVAPPEPPIEYPSSWSSLLSMFWTWLKGLF